MDSRRMSSASLALGAALCALAAPSIATAQVDLVATAVAGPAVAGSGAAVQIGYTVRNQGAQPAPASTVAFYLSPDAVITTGDTRIGYEVLASIPAAGAVSGVKATTIPLSMPVGTFYLGAIADYSNQVAEANEANNAFRGATLRVDRPDLAATALSGPAQAAPGAGITLGYSVTNLGSYISTPSTLAFYLSPDAAITTADLRIGYVSVSGLSAGGTSSASKVVTIPATVTPGAYYLGAIADYSSLVTETNEGNNAFTGPAIAVGKPDLVSLSVSGPAAAVPGARITVSDAVVNQGTSTAPASAVGIYLSTDQVIDRNDLRIGYRSVGTLGVAGTSSGASTPTIPPTLASGTYYLGAIANYSRLVGESSEANNAVAGNAIVVGLPDLAQAAVGGPAAALQGRAFQVSDGVVNQGPAEAGPTTVGLYLSADQVIDRTDLRIGYRSVGALGVGASSAGAASVTIPASQPSGTYYLGAVANYSRLVAEVTDANNALLGNAIYVGDAQPPTVPGSAVATAVSATEIDLSWAPSSDAYGVAGYRLRRDAVVFPALVPGPAAVDGGLAPLTAYCYAVQAVDVAGNASAFSAAGAQSCATTGPDVTRPQPPAGLAAVATSASTVDLTWDAATDDVGVVEYEVSRGDALVQTPVAWPTVPAYSDGGLAGLTVYCYTVRARDAAGNWSVSTAPACATTPSVAGLGQACTGAGQGSCPAGLKCESGVCCDALGPACCTQGVSCGGGLACNATAFACFTTCVDLDSSQCASAGDYCLANACVPKAADGAACAANAQCQNTCLAGVCAPLSAAGGACDAADGAADCLPGLGLSCPAGTCVRPLGSACAAASECQSGFCADGFCCDSACDQAVCAACNAPGFEGTCRMPGDDPACGIIDCSQLPPDLPCMRISDITSARCGTLGACKPPNTASTCIYSEPLPAGTVCGICRACNGRIGGCFTAPVHYTCGLACQQHCSTQGFCQVGPPPAGTRCDDANLCTAGEACDATVTCLPGTPVADGLYRDPADLTCPVGACMVCQCSAGVLGACACENPCTH